MPFIKTAVVIIIIIIIVITIIIIVVVVTLSHSAVIMSSSSGFRWACVFFVKIVDPVPLFNKKITAPGRSLTLSLLTS